MSRSKRVLVIEPSSMVRLLLETHLKKAGHQVMPYADVASVLRDVPTFQVLAPEVILLAVDTRLPTWFEEAQQLRRVWGPQVLLVALLSCRERERLEVQRALNRLPALYVHQPVEMPFVLSLVFALHATPGARALEVEANS